MVQSRFRALAVILLLAERSSGFIPHRAIKSIFSQNARDLNVRHMPSTWIKCTGENSQLGSQPEGTFLDEGQPEGTLLDEGPPMDGGSRPSLAGSIIVRENQGVESIWEKVSMKGYKTIFTHGNNKTSSVPCEQRFKENVDLKSFIDQFGAYEGFVALFYEIQGMRSNKMGNFKMSDYETFRFQNLNSNIAMKEALKLLLSISLNVKGKGYKLVSWIISGRIIEDGETPSDITVSTNAFDFFFEQLLGMDSRPQEVLDAETFFEDLREGGAKVSLSTLVSTYYVQEMIQDGIVAKEQLTVIAQGKRQLDFDLFFDVCSTLNQMQDEFQSSDDYNPAEIEKKDEARKVFDELRGEKPKVSLSELKSLYYFDDMLRDGVITSKQLSNMTDNKKLLDFSLFYEARRQLDEIVDGTERSEPELDSNPISDPEPEPNSELEPNSEADMELELEEVEVESSKEEVIAQHLTDFAAQLETLDKDNGDANRESVPNPTVNIPNSIVFEDSEENRLEEEKSRKVDTIIDLLFIKLSSRSDTVSTEEIKGWTEIKSMLQENAIDAYTVDNLLKAMGIQGSLNSDDFYAFIFLLNEATGRGFIETWKESSKSAENCLV